MLSNSRGTTSLFAAVLLFSFAHRVTYGFQSSKLMQSFCQSTFPRHIVPTTVVANTALRPHEVHTALQARKLEYSGNRGRGFGNNVNNDRGGKRAGGKQKRKNQDLRSRREREHWLQRATMNLLDTETYPPGSLTKGKWHELHSMMVAWSKLAQEEQTDKFQRTSSSMEKNGGGLIDSTAPAVVIEGLLKRVIDERRAGNEEARTTTKMYNLAIDAWAARSGLRSKHGPASARRANEIVRHMQGVYESEGDPDFKPNPHSFLVALGAWTKSSSSDRDDAAASSAERAREMLMWMEELHEAGRNDEARPGVAAYSLVLDAYARSGNTDAGIKAEELIRHMTESGKVKPNTFCYNILIKAWTKSSRSVDSAEKAERVLREMETLYAETGDESVKPDVVSYSSVINAWANGRARERGARRAEEILDRMETMAEAGDRAVQPNTVTFNACLKAWCRSGDRAASSRTEALLKRMEKLHQAGNADVKPDLISYNTYLHVLSLKGGDPNAAQHAEEVLLMMEQMHESGKSEWSPNLFSYNTVIESWSRSRDPNAAQRAYAVLRKLVRRDGVTADTFSYNNVIFALSKSKMPGAARRAEELLFHMEDAFNNGTEAVKPDVFGYSSAINAWSRSGEQFSARRAEQLLERMESMYAAGDEDMKPNTVTYNSVIDAWANDNSVYGARRAEFLLRKMEALYEAGDETVQPNSVTYNAVLNSWARSGTKCCARKAENYLDQMWQLYEAGNKDVKPDGCSYNTLINAISKSHIKGKAQKALRTLRRMDKLYQAGNRDTRPNECTYTSVLNSCAFSLAGDQRMRRKALYTAIFTLEELQKSQYGSPNHVTYRTFLKACANLIPIDDEMRSIVIEPVFLQCCRDGQVDELVLAQLRDTAPAELYNKLLGGVATGSAAKIHDLPVEWRCNVRQKKRWRNRSMVTRKGRSRSAGVARATRDIMRP